MVGVASDQLRPSAMAVGRMVKLCTLLDRQQHHVHPIAVAELPTCHRQHCLPVDVRQRQAMTHAVQPLVDLVVRRRSHLLATSMWFVAAVDVVALLVRHAIDVAVDGGVDVDVVAALVQRRRPHDSSVYVAMSVYDEVLDDAVAAVVGTA